MLWLPLYLNGLHLDPDLDPMFDALRAGDPGPLVMIFHASGKRRVAILRRLLETDLDGPVAAALALIWQDITASMPDGRMSLLQWYLGAETATCRPARKAVHLAVVTQLVGLADLPPTEAGCDLGFAVVRIAVESGGSLALKRAASGLLHRLAAIWVYPAHPQPVRLPMLLAAIQLVDLPVIKALIDGLPDGGPLPPDMEHAWDWAIGLMIELVGIDPWMEQVIDRQFRRDPHCPTAARRKAQLGQHQGQPFAAFAPLFRAIRFDPHDVSLKPVLQFAFWCAYYENLPAETALLSGRLRALDQGWSDAGDHGLPLGPASADPPPVGADLARLADHAVELAAVDIDLASPFTPQELRAAFDQLVQAMASAAMPAEWGVPDVLQATWQLLQIDRREFSWIVHFVDAPHAQGLPQYGSVDLRYFPVLHAGLMATAAALCRAGLDWLLAGNGATSHGPIAQLAQLHTRSCLAIDRTDQALAVLDRLDDLGILADIVAIERDNCRLQRGDVASAQAAPPPGRTGSQVHGFLDQADWTLAEGVRWTTLADDPAIQDGFDVVWPDGRLDRFDHATPAGRIASAALPGLSLIAEDMLLGPAGHVLRPNTYHTSAEYPWDSAVVVAAHKRALRLRPTSTGTCDQPVLLLEAFEALRWRNYYHWMIPILSRVALALEHGLLADRLLVVPEGLSPWMDQTLALIGLPPDRRIAVPFGHKRRFGDTLLMSSIEHVSSAATRALRRRLLGPMALSQPLPADGHHLFLSRSTQKLRKLQNELDIEQMAREMGFKVIAPQDYSIPDQISLFAAARGIAAVEGAALTNTIFSPPGARVLAILCINDMMPIFNDLSIVLGHHHRKLAGRGLAGPDLAGVATANRFQPPFAVDLDLARQSLSWVQGGCK